MLLTCEENFSFNWLYFQFQVVCTVRNIYSVLAWTYYKWTLIVTLMNSCTCLCQKYHNDILNMPPRFDVMIVTVTFPG